MSTQPKAVTKSLTESSTVDVCGFKVYPIKVAHAIAEVIACEKPFIIAIGKAGKLIARFYVLTYPHTETVKAATELTEEKFQELMALDAGVLAEFVKAYEMLSANTTKIAGTMDSGKNPTRATGL